MNLIEIEKAVAKVQEQLFKKANDQSIGLFKSRFRGSGVQFKEHQIYNPGDDVRFIDWKLSAKSVNKTFVKTFEEERNVEVVSILDLSPTMLMGFNQKSKLQASIEVIFLIYLITQKSKDFQRVVIFSDTIKQLPLLSGRKGISTVMSLLKKMNLLDDSGSIKHSFEFEAVEMKKKMAFLKAMIAKKKEVLYFSDFFDSYPKKDFDQFLVHRNFHCFSLRTPLDYANKKPFSFKSQSHGFVSKLNSVDDDSKQKKYKNLKYLDLDKDYLEDFISSMRRL